MDPGDKTIDAAPPCGTKASAGILSCQAPNTPGILWEISVDSEFQRHGLPQVLSVGSISAFEGIKTE